MPDTPYTQGFKAGMAWKEKEQMAKRSFLDEAIYKATIKERERVVNVFSIETKHNGKTHYEGIDCWFCKAVNKIEEK